MPVSLINHNLLAVLKISFHFDLCETFLFELFINGPFDGPADQLIWYRRARTWEVGPLVAFVGGKVGASVIVVVNIRCMGANKREENSCMNISRFISATNSGEQTSFHRP